MVVDYFWPPSILFMVLRVWASVSLISPDSEQVEKIGTSLPPHCIRTRACLVDLDSMS